MYDPVITPAAEETQNFTFILDPMLKKKNKKKKLNGHKSSLTSKTKETKVINKRPTQQHNRFNCFDRSKSCKNVEPGSITARSLRKNQHCLMISLCCCQSQSAPNSLEIKPCRNLSVCLEEVFGGVKVASWCLFTLLCYYVYKIVVASVIKALILTGQIWDIEVLHTTHGSYAHFKRTFLMLKYSPED